jgi:hypothetical protein
MKNVHDVNVEGCRALFAAIIHQAAVDACSYRASDEALGARRFIDENNILFIDYCELLDLDPTYTAKLLQRRIKSLSMRKLRNE